MKNVQLETKQDGQVAQNTTLDIFAEIEKAGEVVQEKQQIDLGPISALANKQKMLEGPKDERHVGLLKRMIEINQISIKSIEEALKSRGADLYNVRQVQIPEMMKEWGLDSIKTIDGAKIEIKDGISVTTRDQAKLFLYMRENGAAALIKNNFVIEVDTPEQVERIKGVLGEAEIVYAHNESVHAQTLKKFVKDSLKEGKKPPEDAVSTFEYKVSKLK